MSVIVTGMEMPKNCVECEMSDHFKVNECPMYEIEKGDYWDKRYEKCPLIPLLPEHGRLGDLDKLLADIKKHYFDNQTVIRCAEIAIANAPTIVDAERREI